VGSEALGELQSDRFQAGIQRISLHERNELLGRGADCDVLFVQEIGQFAFASGAQAREEVAFLKGEVTFDLAGERRRGSAHQHGVGLSGGQRRLEPRAQGERCHVLLVQAPGDLADSGFHG